MAVNLSARQFQQPHLVETVAQTLAETRLSPCHLELEITETVVMHDVDFTTSMLKDLQVMGVNLAVDDFGTGYSSLGYLKRFPLNTIKIDQSFIRELTIDPNDAAIVTAIIALGRGLNLNVVAEGVETQAQLDYLRSLNCEEMQGYLFSKPMPSANATEFLQRYRLKGLLGSRGEHDRRTRQTET
jgi:EAL domain-containing protein (putative c-di-GMP-specific phosphodiesterase class I)